MSKLTGEVSVSIDMEKVDSMLNDLIKWSTIIGGGDWIVEYLKELDNVNPHFFKIESILGTKIIIAPTEKLIKFHAEAWRLYERMD